MASCIRSEYSSSKMILSSPTPSTSAASLLLLLRFNDYPQPGRVDDPDSELLRPPQDERSLPRPHGCTHARDVPPGHERFELALVVDHDFVVRARVEIPGDEGNPVASLR